MELEETSSEPEPEPVMAEEKKEPASITGIKKKTKEESDPIGRFLVAAVIIVAIGVSGWFIYDFGLLDSVVGNKDSNDPKQTVQNTTRTSTPDNESQFLPKEDEDRQESVSEQKKENDVPKSVSIAEQSKGSIYGLRGGAVPEAQSGYTIVVHSLRDKAKAEEIRQNLSAEGYLTILQSARVSGSTYWRVGVGQFKNVEDAKQAINDLPAPYKQNNFIRKF
ncbi:MAG: SPOR domain-containing protein [Balneolaceae bacterium]|nr:SPOR domain-containing protein [Balneolaceae bacterium]